MSETTQSRKYSVTPRPTKLEWLKQYLIGLCLPSGENDGEYRITVHVHRGSVSRVRIVKTNTVAEC